MSNAVRADSYEVLVDGVPARFTPVARLVAVTTEEHWTCFAAIWWDIGLVATPARSILAIASIAHDAVDEWRDEFPYLLHDVPCCFRITWSRAIWKRAGRQAQRDINWRRDHRNTMRAWERAEWPSLPVPGRNDYRGNVTDTAWLQDAPWVVRWTADMSGRLLGHMTTAIWSADP